MTQRYKSKSKEKLGQQPSGNLKLKMLNSSGTTIPEIGLASADMLANQSGTGSFVMKAKKKLTKAGKIINLPKFGGNTESVRFISEADQVLDGSQPNLV